MALTPKEQKLLIKLQQQELNLATKIANSKGGAVKTAEKLKTVTKQILALEQKRGDLADDLVDAVKEAESTQAKIQKQLAMSSKDMSKQLQSQVKFKKNLAGILKMDQNLAKMGKVDTKTLKLKTDYVDQINEAMNDKAELASIEYDLQEDIVKALKDGDAELAKQLKKIKGVVKGAKDLADSVEEATNEEEVMNEFFGDFVDMAADFNSKNPLAKGILAAKVLMDGLAKTAERMQARTAELGGEFGAIVRQPIGEMMFEAATRAQEWELEIGESLATIKKLSVEQGMTLAQATEYMDTLGEQHRALGVSVEQAADLEKMFGLLSGRSKEQSAEFQKQVYRLAEMEGVAPDAVMEDIANNMDLFAAHSKDGGMNIARASITARKLGLSLSSMAATQEGLLDFQSSLSAEYEAELMIGEDLDLQKARMLAMDEDQSGMMEELLKNKAIEKVLNGNNIFQKKAIAKAMNMELSDLKTAHKLYKESLKVQEDMSNVEPNQIAGAETIDSLTQFQRSLQTIGDLLADTFIPIMNVLLWPFQKLVEWAKESEAAMIALKIVLGTVGIAMAALAVKAVIAGVAALWEAVGLASITTMGWGAAAAVAIAVAAIATMTSEMSKAKNTVPQMAEGGMVRPKAGGTMVNVAEAGQSEVITPLEKLPGLVNVDNQGVANEVGSLKQELRKQAEMTRQMMNNFEKYFGVGGTVARESGKAIVKAQESGVI